MSDTNASGISIARVPGRTFPLLVADPPAANPLVLQALRTTALNNLGVTVNSVTSNEFRQDGQVTDVIRVGATAGGDHAFELSYGVSDDLFESALFNVFDNTLIFGGTVGLTAFGAGTIDVADGSQFKENHIVELRGLLTGDAGRGVYVISSIAVDTLTVTPIDANTNAVTAGFTATDGSTATNVRPTELQVCGYQADANGEIALTLNGPLGVLTFTTGSDTDGLRGAADDLEPGMLIKLAGFALATSNVYARIVEVDTAADTITFEAPTGLVADPAAGVQPRIFFGDFLINGVQPIPSHQYAVELVFSDHSPVTRQLLLGMALNEMSVNVTNQQIVTGGATFFGLTGRFSNTENAAAGTGDLYTSTMPIHRIDSPQNRVYNASNHVGRLGVGASPIAASGLNFAIDASISLTRNLRRQNAVGFFGAAGIGRGEMTMTGTLNQYFDSAQLAQQVIDGNETSLDIYFRGDDGRAVAYDFPRIVFDGGLPQIPGKNQDVTIPLTWQATLNSLGYTGSVTRFPYTE